MMKVFAFLAGLAAVVSLVPSGTEARSQYFDDVNAVCGSVANDCGYCHANAANYDAYLASGACGVCPDAPACNTAPPPPDPAPTCTDADLDGYFAEPGCAQLYDCDDANSAIHPGAREVACDGIDQDCSGADKLKGKGCRKR